jgi:hypothetical protein
VIGASTGIEPLFRLTDPHHPGYLHQATRAILAQAGHDSLVEEVTRTATATPDDVCDVFQAAWGAGCKGITVYRHGSRSSQRVPSSAA